MTKTYRYRPPFKYFLLGSGGMMCALIFGLVIGKGGLWFSMTMAIFCLLCLAVGTGFLTIFFRKFHLANLMVGEDFIEIPGRWRKRTKLYTSDIKSMSEFHTYDDVIELESKHGFHLIEKKWMKGEDFAEVRAQLISWGEFKSK